MPYDLLTADVFEDPEPPTPKLNGRALPAVKRPSAAVPITRPVASPEPASSTWDSMHAPKSIKTSVYVPRTSPSTPLRSFHVMHNRLIRFIETFIEDMWDA